MKTLRTRTLHALAHVGIGDGHNDPDPKILAKLTRSELLRIPECGQKALEDIERLLAKHGLKLNDYPFKYELGICPHCGKPNTGPYCT